ncbi:MAG: HEAT repeat domain-containing protein [Planctomycetota bacterium]|nr:HEAT repeat domain-containing protein [Planctomycetota bacterium]
MTQFRTPAVFRRASWALLLVPGCLLLSACNQNRNASTQAAETPTVLTPDKDPRVTAHLDTFARTEAMITRWDTLRNDGRAVEARALEPKIQAEVDADFTTFMQGARGALGPHAQYLAVSGLGFSARPEATTLLVERLSDRDARLVGNALIAIGVRADPNTPTDVLINRIAPVMPTTVKRYAPLALAKVLEARQRAGLAATPGSYQQALSRLGALAVDPDPIVRLHVVRGLQALQHPGVYDYLAVLVGDPKMRVRWAAASALERTGDPRGFPGVVRLLHDVAPDSKHIIRDILVSYAGRMQGRPLTQQEVDSLGIGPRAWSQWYTMFRRARGMGSGQNVQPNGAMEPAPRRTTPSRSSQPGSYQPRPVQPTYQPPAAQPGSMQPAPQPVQPPRRSGARGGG